MNPNVSPHLAVVLCENIYLFLRSLFHVYMLDEQGTSLYGMLKENVCAYVYMYTSTYIHTYICTYIHIREYS
jgi:hypothetical protein